MFVPISDDNPLRHVHRPWVTWAIIATCCGIFLVQSTGMPHQVLASFAIVPAELFKVGVLGGPAFGPNDGIAVAERYTLVSYMFLHGDIMHLVGNMLFLWVFGDNVEDALGHLKYALFYVFCGVAGGLMHAVMLPGSGLPLIGASGAIAGVIAAYVILYPRVMVWVLAFRFFPLKITAAFALGAWILTQFAMLAVPYVMPGANIGPISWWSHIGGIIAGGAALLLMGRPAAGRDGAAR
jgi:membrane associated rhomboid family serine protease